MMGRFCEMPWRPTQTPPIPGPRHSNRLDRETSGLVLVAKTAAAARRFGLLMQQHRFTKEYLAIVWGWPEWNEHTVDASLDRQGEHGPSGIWLKQAIVPAGAPARTE